MNYCWWECKLAQPLWKTVWRFLKTLITEQYDEQYDPAILLLGIYPGKTALGKDTYKPIFMAILFTIAKK